MSAAIPVIDTDSHISEPPDLWTSRLSSAKYGDLIPHVVWDERRQMDRWVVGEKRLTGVSSWAMAGWPDYPPSHPPRYEDADPGAFEVGPRVERLDEYGVHAQVLYPNLLAFFSYAFLALDDLGLRLACVEAYNDFLTDFSNAAPGRFIPLTALPFWDVDASLAEIQRCHDAGHKGVVFASKPERIGFPPLRDDHWAPVLELIQSLGSSVNFHVGFQEMDETDIRGMIGMAKVRADYARDSAISMLGNSSAIADVIMSGLCERYPDLPFVSVESGFGWLPYFVEAMDWQWLNSGAAKEMPERLMPSEYFKRQIVGSFWFEQESIKRLIDLYPDNVMFETDFPHPTSLSPGPASSSLNPKDMIEASLGGVPEDIRRKVLYGTAARIYNLEVPAP